MRHSLRSPVRIGDSQSGVALISVLIIVALITVVVVGFLVTAGLQMASSRSYNASSGARRMADTAVNFVQAQINEATSQGTSYAWASQPGAIRVYKNDGTLYQIYKLYSAQNLTTTDATKMDISTTTAGDNDMPPTSWASDPATWVDLNAPATDSQGNLHFPIFDWRNATNVDGCSYSSTIPGATTAQAVPMPVTWLYVLQNGEILVPDAGDNGTKVTFANSNAQPSSTDPIVGRIAYWTDDETCKVNINTAGGDGVMATGSTDPTPIANDNFWDTPHYNSPDDYGKGSSTGFAGGQPVTGEFQRYPGHPAVVALNNILNELGWTLPSSSFYNSGATPGITPRYAYGGSKGGTAVTVYNGASAATTLPLVPNPQNRLYSSVADMLFQPNRTPSSLNTNSVSTPRQASETARFFLTAHSEAPEVNLFGEPRVSIWPVWAPGSTVLMALSGSSGYGGPANRTTIDNLLSFASTVNGNGPAATQYPYYFIRQDSTSSTTDIGFPRNQTLLSYLDKLTSMPIPGYGNYFQNSTKYGQAGTRQILTEIFDYIRTINSADTSQPLVGGVDPIEYDREWGVGAGNYSSENNANGWYLVSPSTITSSSAPHLGWSGNYQGFGAYPRLNEVAIQFVALAQGALSTGSSGNYLNQAYVNSPLISAGDSGANPNGASPPTVNIITAITTKGANRGQLAAPGNTVAIQAFIHLDFTDPAQMFITDGVNDGHINPYVWAEISGLNSFQVATSASSVPYPLGFTADDAILMAGNGSGGGMDNNWDCINFAMGLGASGPSGRTIAPGVLNGETASAAYYSNPFYSKIIPLAIPSGSINGSGSFFFTGGPITIKLYDGGANGPKATGNASGQAQLIQTYTIDFGQPTGGGSYTSTLPLPVVVPAQFPTGTTPTGCGPQVGIENGTPYTGSPATNPTWTTDGYDRWSPSNTSPEAGFILPGDTVQSMVLSPQWSDARDLSCATVPSGAFQEHPAWGRALAYCLFAKESPFLAASAGGSGTVGAVYVPPYPSATLGPGVLNPNTTTSPGASTTISGFQPYVPPELSASVDSAAKNFPPAGSMDWDTGVGCLPDGPWINKVDEGNVNTASGALPDYQDTGSAVYPNASLFSPNHEVPSAGMFGSLSTGVDPTGANPTPWRTLLFRPAPPGHLGGVAPEDHLLLDLFWMPVAEPYAISEPFTSAGKINLNYQIEPFTYITRSTAVRAVLNSEKVAAVNVNLASIYKNNSGSVSGSMPKTRYAINVPATLAQFDDKFNGTDTSGVNSSATPDIFRSASQICDMYLIPLKPPELGGSDYSKASTFATAWYDGKTYGLVGDNVRERPYTNIYGLVTTKSNSYTVYYTVQSLKNAEPPALQSQWDESKGAVFGEYRGSTTIERYIDPNQTLPDFAATGNAGVLTVDGNLASTPPQTSDYNWRIVDNHQFSP